MKRRTHRGRIKATRTGMPDTLIDRPLPRLVRMGSTGHKPRPRTAAGLPLTVAQAEVLDMLDTETSGPGPIGRHLGRSSASVTSSLYALQDRGLTVRVPGRGWRRA